MAFTNQKSPWKDRSQAMLCKYSTSVARYLLERPGATRIGETPVVPLENNYHRLMILQYIYLYIYIYIHTHTNDGKNWCLEWESNPRPFSYMSDCDTTTPLRQPRWQQSLSLVLWYTSWGRFHNAHLNMLIRLNNGSIILFICWLSSIRQFELNFMLQTKQ